MSTFTTITTEVATRSASIQAADGGIIDWATSFNDSALVLIRAVAVTLGIIFVIMAAIASRGSMARIIITGISAGILIWVVFNITDVSDTVGNDLPGAASIVQTVSTEHLLA